MRRQAFVASDEQIKSDEQEIKGSRADRAEQPQSVRETPATQVSRQQRRMDVSRDNCVPLS